jgi:hypothetical protein
MGDTWNGGSTMTMLLTIDPGTDTGWALWGPSGLELNGLMGCGLSDKKFPLYSGTAVVWIERPVVYPRSKVPPNDLIQLALTAGQISGWYEARGCKTCYVQPADWKGQVPKAIHHRRIRAELSPAERKLLDDALATLAPSKRHNVLDAVGIGLWIRRHYAA